MVIGCVSQLWSQWFVAGCSESLVSGAGAAAYSLCGLGKLAQLSYVAAFPSGRWEVTPALLKGRTAAEINSSVLLRGITLSISSSEEQH